MHAKRKRIIAASTLVLGCFAVTTLGQVKPGASKETPSNGTPVLWREPDDIASRDLFYGPGGKDHAPHGTFTFVEEDMNGTTPKFDVVDQDGVRWRVKLGVEARPETAASRLVWAMGYFANQDYFMPSLHVENMKHLRRGRSFVSKGGNVENVRLKRHVKDEKKVGSWSWSKDPFTDSREWYGLRVLMVIMNNWDLKDINNSVYRTHKEPAEDRYVVSDLGAAFGPTGLNSATKGQPAAYCSSKMIKSVSGDFVDFNVPSGPSVNFYLNFPELGKRLSLLWLGHHIPRQHARWVGDHLARLSNQQIHDLFRASGYSPAEVEDLSSTLIRRIGELEKL